MGECYIPGIVAKHSGECSQTFRGMSPNIPGMFSNIPRNVTKHSGKYPEKFRRISLNNPENTRKHAGACRKTPCGKY